MEDDADSGPLEEIETDGNKDQASSGKKKSKRKDKLSGEKLTKDYDAWFQKIIALHQHTKLQDSYLKQVIANHCNMEQVKKTMKIASGIRPHCQSCMELATRYLDF